MNPQVFYNLSERDHIDAPCPVVSTLAAVIPDDMPQQLIETAWQRAVSAAVSIDKKFPEKGLSDEEQYKLLNLLRIKYKKVFQLDFDNPQKLIPFSDIEKYTKHGNYLVAVKSDPMMAFFGIIPQTGHIFNVRNGKFVDKPAQNMWKTGPELFIITQILKIEQDNIPNTLKP